MSVNTKMTAIADAIRAKTGGTAALSLDAMAEAIAGLGDGLPDSIAAIDGGTFTMSSTHSSGVYKIAHNLGDYPDVFVIYNISDMQSLSYRSLKYYLILYGRYTYTSSTSEETYDGVTSRGGYNSYSSSRISVSSISSYFNNQEIYIPYSYNANLMSGKTYAWVALKFDT